MLPLSKRSWLVVAGVVLGVAARARAQDVSAAAVGKGPRLVYVQGPGECLTEEGFRGEVAVALDGDDHFDGAAADVLRVAFESVPGGYKGTLEYTDAGGKKEPAKVQTYYNCEILGRMVGTSASYYVPRVVLPGASVVPPPSAPSPPSASSPPSVPPPAAPPPSGSPAPGERRGDVIDPRARVPSLPARPPRRCEPPPDEMDLTIGLSGFMVMSAFYTADVGGGFGLMGDVRYDFLSIGLELRGILPGRVYAREPVFPNDPTKPTREVELDVSQISGALVPCARWKFLMGCAVAQLGTTIAKDVLQDFKLATFATGPRVGVEVPIAERFAIFGFGEVLFAVQYAGVRYDIEGDVPAANTQWVQPIASGFFGLGLTATFK